jgi:tRNA(adenine34) deaminase
MIKQSPYMEMALEEARKAYARNEVPVGAVIVSDKEVLARAGNRVEELGDATAHAEMLAIREASKVLGTKKLVECVLYVTLEPCPMCAMAISHARLKALYFGASDTKMGGVEHGPRVLNSTSCHHTPDVYGGISEAEARDLMQQFFKEKR